MGVTSYLASVFVNSVKNSAVYALVLRFLIYIQKEYRQSRFYNMILKFVQVICREYEGSRLKKFIFRKGKIQSLYETSLVCAFICYCYNILSKLAHGVFSIVEKLSKGGFVHSISLKISSYKGFTFVNVFGVFVLCMIVCPHEIWNNLYAVFAAFAFLAVYMIRSYKHLENPSIKTDGFGLVLFVVFTGLSGLYAYNMADAVRIILFVYSAVIFSFIVMHSLNTEDKFKAMIKFISIAGFVTSVIGIIQRMYGVEVNPEYVDVVANASMPGRVFSTFANPNNFAELLVLIMPANAALIIDAPTKKEKGVWALFLAVDFVAIGMSYSRSCWVALVIAAVVMLLIYDWKLLIPCVVIFIAVLPVLPESITDRMLTIGSMKDTSNASRFYIWEGAWRLVREYFVSGVGAGPLTFKEYYVPVANSLATTAPHSHMLYMELIIEFGIVAFVGFIGYILFLTRKAFAALGRVTASRRGFIGALLGSLFGMLFVFLVEYVWFYPRDMFIFWIVLGLLSVAVKKMASVTDEEQQ